MGTWTIAKNFGPEKVSYLSYEPSPAGTPNDRAVQASVQSNVLIVAYDRCLEERRTQGTNDIVQAPSAAIIIAALAVELTFKATIYSVGGDAKKNGKKIHNLHDLYLMLPEDVRVRVVEQTTLAQGVFEQALRQIATAFEKIRYYFDDEGSSFIVDLNFLHRLVLAIEPENSRIIGAPTKAHD